jgi:hypothetical protein
MDSRNWIARAAAHSGGVVNNRARIMALNVGKGTGAECAYCHKPITCEQIEYQVEAFVLSGLRTLRLHRLCHHLWESQG